MRSESLRRLHIAAQQGETLFFQIRPLAGAEDASPATLRLALRPAAGGLDVEVVKRRRPQCEGRVFIPMSVGARVHLLPQRDVMHAVPAPTLAPLRDNVPELTQ